MRRIVLAACLGLAALSVVACGGNDPPINSPGGSPGGGTDGPPYQLPTPEGSPQALRAAPAPAATSGPAVIADKTKLDETLGRGVNLAYKAARLACELAVDLGKIKGERAAFFQNLNRRAYAAVLAVDRAYATANARSYKAAVDEAHALVAQLTSLAGGEAVR